MSEIDSSYQPKVGLEQGADGFYMKEDGTFKFYDTDLTGTQLRNMLIKKTEIKGSGAVLSVINLPKGYVVLKLVTGNSNASAWLPSCTAGDEMVVVLQNFAVESVLSVFISMSGCSLVGTQFSDLSSISLHTSAASAAWIKFKSFTNDEWSVVERSGQHLINEHSIS